LYDYYSRSNDGGKMMNREMISKCGDYCEVCDWREKMNCPGCQKAKGMMFHGECTVAKCASEKGLEHCGVCEKMPCQPLTDAFNQPDHGDNGERKQNLENWSKGNYTFIELTPLKKG